jgi:hypothetical protein
LCDGRFGRDAAELFLKEAFERVAMWRGLLAAYGASLLGVLAPDGLLDPVECRDAQECLGGNGSIAFPGDLEEAAPDMRPACVRVSPGKEDGCSLKPFFVTQRVRRPPGKGGARQPEASLAWVAATSGKRLLGVLGKRLGRYGLQLHPTKTRFVDFRFKRPNGRHPATVGTTFNFLGFTHVWGRSRRGKNVVRQITAKDRYARALASVTEWCRRNLHRPFREQHARLSRMIRGHCAYYGITGNGDRIRWYHHQLVRIRKKWLRRRGRHSNLPWPRFRTMLARHPLPSATIVHQYAVP